MKIAGSASESGSISQRHGSADPYPDPHQNVMDPELCLVISSCLAGIGLTGLRGYLPLFLPQKCGRWGDYFSSCSYFSANINVKLPILSLA
jgi:hypothetical protein